MQPFNQKLHQRNRNNPRDPGLKIQESRLIYKCKKGNVKAFKSLYDLHKEKLYNVIYRILGNHEDAEDTLQEVFIIVYQKIATFRGEASFATWLHRIAVNACLNKVRKSKPINKSELSENEIIRDPHSIKPSAQMTSIILDQEIQVLPPGYRTIFILYEVEGFTHEEIAKILDISSGTSKSQLSRAKQHLKKRLTPYLDVL
jgi:RNA polymerase sigma-70 factor, ECF subfamily